MRSDDFKWYFSKCTNIIKNTFCSESGICFKITFVPNTVNVPKPRQKHEIRQCIFVLQGIANSSQQEFNSNKGYKSEIQYDAILNII